MHNLLFSEFPINMDNACWITLPQTKINEALAKDQLLEIGKIFKFIY